MTDLLSPEEVRKIDGERRGLGVSHETVARLCRDYLTLWDRYEKLADDLDVVRKGWVRTLREPRS